ncbi:MAG: hypothetical protein V8R01_06525 [Bacilli bacterium]
MNDIIIAIIGGLSVAVPSTLATILNSYFGNRKKVFERNSKLNELERAISETNKNMCKNYLVRFLSDVELGKPVTDAEIQRAYEEFEQYETVHHGNGYIHSKWELLMKEGR